VSILLAALLSAVLVSLHPAILANIPPAWPRTTLKLRVFLFYSATRLVAGVVEIHSVLVRQSVARLSDGCLSRLTSSEASMRPEWLVARLIISLAGWRPI
jgi:hypothetical protein